MSAIRHRLSSIPNDPYGPIVDCSCGLFTMPTGARFSNRIPALKVGSAVTVQPSATPGDILDAWRRHCEIGAA